MRWQPVADPPQPLDGRCAPRFRRLPFDVDAHGRSAARAAAATRDGACATRRHRPASSTPRAIRSTLAPAPLAPTFATPATIGPRPLDSKIAQCEWHRVVAARRAAGRHAHRRARVLRRRSLYRRRARSARRLARLRSRRRGRSMARWDCLVRSRPGRYLWLELELESNGAATPRSARSSIEFPRLSLRRYLPAVFGVEPVSADFTDRFLALFDTTLCGIERRSTARRGCSIRCRRRQRRATRALDFLSWLGSWIGIAFDRNWDVAERRRFLKHAGALFDRRGTLGGLREQLLLLLGFDRIEPCARRAERACGRCVPAPRNCAPPTRAAVRQPPPLVLEHFRLRRWLCVGAGRLGDEAVLWGERIVDRTRLGENAAGSASRGSMRSPDPLHDPFLVYAHQFTVFVPARCRDSRSATRKALENLLRTEAPAHARVPALRRAAISHRRAVDDRLRRGRRRRAAGRHARRDAARAGPVLTGAAASAGRAWPSRSARKAASAPRRGSAERGRFGHGPRSSSRIAAAAGACPACDFGPFTRNAYWTGKLMLARDFVDEQRYVVEKLRHHNQHLHGAGVVCGLKVVQHDKDGVPQPLRLRRAGHRRSTAAATTSSCARRTASTSGRHPDDQGAARQEGGWRRPDEHTLQICIRYRECETEQVPVLYDECGCDDDKCAPNRILESYELDVLRRSASAARRAAVSGRLRRPVEDERSTAARTATCPTASCSRPSSTGTSATRSSTRRCRERSRPPVRSLSTTSPVACSCRRAADQARSSTASSTTWGGGGAVGPTGPTGPTGPDRSDRSPARVPQDQGVTGTHGCHRRRSHRPHRVPRVRRVRRLGGQFTRIQSVNWRHGAQGKSRRRYASRACASPSTTRTWIAERSAHAKLHRAAPRPARRGRSAGGRSRLPAGARSRGGSSRATSRRSAMRAAHSRVAAPAR